MIFAAPLRVPVFEGAAAFRADPRRSAAAAASARIREETAGVIERVRREGDAALAAFGKRFDGVDLDAGSFRVSAGELARFAAGATAADRSLLVRARDRIAAYHELQREPSFRMDPEPGARLEWRVLPIPSAGVYVPGGAASYPSTVLMNVVPARVAGVSRIALTTPPRALEASPVLAAALEIAGIAEAYRIGGAHAIAALALGTESIRPVRKIVGPGNAFVAEAKRQLGAIVGTDGFAGPSEVVALADGTARPDWIAADLLAQAEHGSGEERAILITTSAEIARATVAELGRQAASLPTRGTVTRALARHGAVVVVADLEEGIALAEELAPEHLAVLTEDPEALADRLPAAGALLLGGHSPVAAGDYGAGPNHVLPTGGAARFASPLSTGDFRKRQSALAYDRDALRARREDFERFARIEGFEAHARSIGIRFAGDRPAAPERSDGGAP